MPAADARRFYRSIRGSLGAAVAVLALDVGFLGSILFSAVLCPLWLLVSLVRSSLYGPNASLFLTRIAIPMVTFLLVLANDAFQRGVAETNAEKVVAACESYRVDNGRFPRKLDQLVPRYLDSVPVAKYCLGPGRFIYTSSENTGVAKLFWYVAPPRLRKVYDFEARSWSYLE